MIEVTITEIVLFAWAILATGVALKYHHAHWHVVGMMKEFLSNESIRNRAVRSWQEFQETSRSKGTQ